MEFNEKDVIYSYKTEEFIKIPKCDLIDFVQNVHAGRHKEMDILRSWEIHFIEKKVPFVVTKILGENIYTLWKETRV